MLAREELHLTKAEILQHVKLLTWLGQYEYESQHQLKSSILSEIQKTDSVIMIKLALSNSLVNELCHDETLVNHWNSVWRLCGLRDVQSEQTNVTGHPGYLPLPTMHSFDLISGLYFYWRYQYYKKHQDDEACEFFKLSLSSGCFAAIYQCLHQQIDALTIRVTTKVAGDAVQIAHRAAELYLAPGYVLQAEVYANLAAEINHQYRYREHIKPWMNRLACSAMQSLYVAEHLMQSSDAAIANAKQMLSLSGLPALDLTSVASHTKHKILTMVPELISQDLEIKHKADVEFQAVISKQAIVVDDFIPEILRDGVFAL